MTLSKNNRTGFVVALIFLAYTLTSFGFYLERSLNGEINHHIMAAEMFGVPAALKERGVEPLYRGPVQSGWDGQFYYYMSNDILARKDTPEHVDSPSYRYQRVGLSLYAALVAKLFGQDWVSPTTFFVSYLMLILAATVAGAHLFSRIGVYPALILLWSLSVGTQITLFNALPDAAADAFLILALAAAYSKRYILSAIPFVFAGLSREVYVLFPSFILLFHLINQGRDLIAAKVIDPRQWIGCAWRWNKYYLLALPGLAAIAWRTYVIEHFGVAPAEQARGVLGFPLASWAEYFLSGVGGDHKWVGANWTAYAEAVSLLMFVLVLAVALWASISALAKRGPAISPETRGVALASIAFVFLYASFGPIVIMHYTGYMKAIAVFFFVIPLLLSAVAWGARKKLLMYLLLLGALAFTTCYNMRVRILPFSGVEDQYTRMSSVVETRPVECFGDYEAAVKVKDIRIMNNGILGDLFGHGGRIVVTVDLTNTGKHDFVSTRNAGTVHMSYQWVDAAGNMKQDGVRTAIPEVLKPGETVELQIISAMPKKGAGDIYMRPSPVQEGCAWFYLINPTVSEALNISIRN